MSDTGSLPPHPPCAGRYRAGRYRAGRYLPLAAVVLGSGIFLAGCNEPNPTAKQPASTDGAAESAPRNAATGTAASPSQETATHQPATVQVTEVQVITDQSGQRWLTPEIPYDVYPDLPSAQELIAANESKTGTVAAGPVLVGSSPAGGQQNAMPKEESSTGTMVAKTSGAKTGAMADEPPAMASTDAPTNPPTPAASETKPAPEMPKNPAKVTWDAILPADILDDEISIVRNRLRQDVLTIANFNAALEQIAQDGWLISALATIAAKHSESFSWKEHALLARKAAVTLAQAATQGGRKHFGKAELAVEQISAVLNNNAPAGLGKPNSEVSIPKTADRAALMQRIKKARNRLRAFASDRGMFQQHLGEAKRQARVMAALAKFITDPEYSGAEEADYQAAAAAVIGAGMTMAQAVKANDFTSFQTALRGTSAACADCHQKYR